MALEGSLKEFGLADILQLIYFQRKSGVLVIESSNDRVRIGFHAGNIVSAESRRRPYDNRLGRMLVRAGVISGENLKRAINEQKQTGQKLGNILYKRRLATAEQLREHLGAQITEMVVHVFAWKLGHYEFNPQAVPMDKELQFSVDTHHLLMEGMRMHDEWSAVEGKISLDSVFRHSGQAGVGLSPDELEVLSFVDNENDVETIAEISGRNEFEVSKLLLALFEKGVLARKEDRDEAAGEGQEAAPKRRLRDFKYLVETITFASLAMSLVLIAVLGTASFQNTSAQEDVDLLKFRLDTYRIQKGEYPPSLDEVMAGNDRWGNPYSYELSEGVYYLRSSGADSVLGTGDDIY